MSAESLVYLVTGANRGLGTVCHRPVEGYRTLTVS
jgi:NAD(P)-dependent dehydrogenase (short-subunit alcohol dehydrogenase family)